MEMIRGSGRKWTGSEIRGNAAAFCAETKKVFAVSGERIKRENVEPYPLADRTAETVRG